MKKRILSALLILSVMLCMAIVPVSAATSYTSGLYTYTVTDGKAKITDVNTSIYGLNGKVTVPSTLGGYPVVAIGDDAYKSCTKMVNVIIPEGVTSIGNYSFYGCNSLTSVTIPESVTSVGGGAFECESLSTVNISSIEAWMNISWASPSNYSSIYSNPLIYAEELYLNGELVTDLVIPDGIKKIKAYSFQGCDSLTSVTIPEEVTSIGSSAFQNCTGLTSVTIPEGVTSIGAYAFHSCAGLTSVTISEGVTSIGDYAFGYCTGLTSITIPKSVTSIGKGAFYCKSLQTVNYTGTEEDWCIIYIGDSNDYLHNADIILNYNSGVAVAEITDAEASGNKLKFISETKIEGEPEISSFGTTFIPLWLFETGSGDVATVEYDNAEHSIQNAQTFGATLTGIPESCKDMAIVGKSFIKDASGNYTWSAAKSASVNDATLKTIE